MAACELPLIILKEKTISLQELLSSRSRFTPELIRILLRERVPMTEQESITANRERSLWNLQLYALYSERRPRASVSMSGPDYEAYLQVFNNNFRSVYLSVEQEYQLWDHMRTVYWCTNNLGFEIIGQATGLSDMEIYGELMLAGVQWRPMREGWTTSSGARFFTLTLAGNYPRRYFR